MPPLGSNIISFLKNCILCINHYLRPLLGCLNLLFKFILIFILTFVWCLNVLSFIATWISISLFFEINKTQPVTECHTKNEPDYSAAQFLTYIYLLEQKLQKSPELELFWYFRHVNVPISAKLIIKSPCNQEDDWTMHNCTSSDSKINRCFINPISSEKSNLIDASLSWPIYYYTNLGPVWAVKLAW